MRRHPTAPVNVARISVATFGTDFTAPEAEFAALIPTAASVLGDHICQEGTAGVRTAPDRLLARKRPPHRHDAGGRHLELDLLGDI